MAENKGEMLKNALLDLGLATIATNFPYGAEVLWGLLADKYFITGVQTAKQAAENLKADLENRGDGKYALKNMKLITDASSMFYDLGNNVYATDWLPVGTVLRFPTMKNGERVENTVGLTNYQQVLTGSDDIIYNAYDYFDILTNGELDHHRFYFFVTTAPLIEHVYFIREWQLILRSGYAQFNVDYYYRYNVEGAPQYFTERQGIFLYEPHKYLGDLIYDTEEEIIFNASAIGGGIKPYHIGEDVSHVDSITGGNGADAGSPVATLPMIGRGGNGGHGGGGGGAAGYCKREMVSTNGAVEIDLTQPVGEMVSGTGGTGTDGTPGYHGGCVIFWDEGGISNA